jgi:hypothetical protein
VNSNEVELGHGASLFWCHCDFLPEDHKPWRRDEPRILNLAGRNSSLFFDTHQYSNQEQTNAPTCSSERVKTQKLGQSGVSCVNPQDSRFILVVIRFPTHEILNTELSAMDRDGQGENGGFEHTGRRGRPNRRMISIECVPRGLRDLGIQQI